MSDPVTLETVAALRRVLLTNVPAGGSVQERDRARLVLYGLQHLHHNHITRDIRESDCISCASMVALQEYRTQ